MIRQNGARPKQNNTLVTARKSYSTTTSTATSTTNNNNGNLRLLAMRRQMVHSFPSSSPSSSSAPVLSSTSPLIRSSGGKVEYVYDENVMDPQTEKLERYYYEDHVDRRCLALTRFTDRGRIARHGRAASGRGRRGGGHHGARDDFHKLSGAFGGVIVNMHSGKKPRHCTGGGKGRGYGSTPRKSKHKSSETTRKLSISCEVLPSLGKDSGPSCRTSETRQGMEMVSRTEASSSYSSSSSSAASTFEESRQTGHSSSNNNSNTSVSPDNRRRHSSNKHRCHQNHTAETYSLVSGIRRMRLAETFVDQTILPATTTGSEGAVTDPDDVSGEASKDRVVVGGDDIFVLRHANVDDKDRRMSGVLNLRHRIIKNLRVSSSLTKEIKAARQLGVIMGAFTLCFLPYFILFLVVAFCHDCIEPGLLTAATWVGYLNSTLNPFLYPLCNVNFRRKFRAMLRCFGPSRSAAAASSAGGYNYYDRNSVTRARYD